MLKKAKETLKSVLDDEPTFNSYMDSCFDKVDVDKSGFIEEKELETLIKKLNYLNLKKLKLQKNKLIML